MREATTTCQQDRTGAARSIWQEGTETFKVDTPVLLNGASQL